MDGFYRYLRLIVPIVSFLLDANLAYPMQLKLSFEEVAQTADLVFVGTVEKQNSRLNEKHTTVFTDVSFKDVVVVHATNQSVQRDSSTVQLTYAGGSAGDVSTTLSDSPSFEDGHRYLICMLDDGKTYTSPIIGGSQGLFEIVKDVASKEEFVLTAGKKAVVGINKEITTSRKRVSHIQEGKAVYEKSEKDVTDRFYPQPPTPSDPADSASISSFLTEKDSENLSPLRLKEFLDYVKDVALKAPFERRIPRRNGRGYFFFKDEDGKVRKKRLPRAKLPVKTLNEAQNHDGESHIPLNVPGEDANPSASDRSIQPLGGQLGACGYRDLHIEMEQVSESSWPYSINEDCMWTWNQFMDVYRVKPDDGGFGFGCSIFTFSHDNEFVGFLDNATLNDKYGANWGPGDLAVTPICKQGECGEIKEADVVWNAAISWTDDSAISTGNSGVVLLRPVNMHELGHAWGEQTGGPFKETYDYDAPTVMHAYFSNMVEDGWGIHAEDAYLIRRLYDDQTTAPLIRDIGVESYFASNGLMNSTTDKPTYYPGESITLSNVTVENMSNFSVYDLRIRFFLSSDRIEEIGSVDRQLGAYWSWATFNAESYSVGNYTTTIPSDIIPGIYFVGAIVTYSGFNEDSHWYNNSTTFFNPITIKSCSFTRSPTSSTFSSSGGTGNVIITGPNECGWSARSNDSWIKITSRTIGQGNGFVSYSVSANPDAFPRTGTMAIAGDTFVVYQDGAGCSYTIAPTSQSFGSSEGTGSVSVTAPRGCNWAAQSNAPWIRITSKSSGNGNGTVKYSVALNEYTVTRTGTLTIAGQTFTITQALRECLRITPAGQRVGSPGGTGYRITVIAGGTCIWNVSSDVSWITTGGGGTGTGTVYFSVAPNPDSIPRTGTITIGGQFFAVIQSGLKCTYNISPQKQSFDDGGGAGSISVTVPDSRCNWTASSQASWITITSGSSGGGNGIVNYTVAANPNPLTRQGLITIAGKNFIVTQSGLSCTYRIHPKSDSFGDTGGAGAIDVTATTGNLNSPPARCKWTALSNVPWITITSAGSGGGNGVVNYSVADNPSPTAREGMITVAGRGFVVTQSGVSCGGYSIYPTNALFSELGGTAGVSVIAPNKCNWTAGSNVSWITFTSGSSGTGIGRVDYSVAANPDENQRTGTMTIAEQTFTVTQLALSCFIRLSPAERWIADSGGAGSVDVTVPSGCGWSISSNVSWITITSGSTGNGNGTAYYTVAANPDTSTRMGILTIGPNTQIHTVRQHGAGCTYSIFPYNGWFDSSGGTGSTDVTAPSGCDWTALSDESWITITSGNSGSGNGTVNYSVEANPSIWQRSGHIIIAGQTLNVGQDGCSVTISPTSQSFADAGGTGSIDVTAPSGCNWLAGSNVPWITITSGDSGSGNGTVNYSVAPIYSEYTRVGTMTIGEQTFTVTQYRCDYEIYISPNSAYSPGAGGTGSINVTAPSGCSWTASSNRLWITITSGNSGSGDGTVNYSVAPNGTGNVRIGTITIGRNTFSLQQNAK